MASSMTGGAAVVGGAAGTVVVGAAVVATVVAAALVVVVSGVVEAPVELQAPSASAMSIPAAVRRSRMGRERYAKRSRNPRRPRRSDGNRR